MRLRARVSSGQKVIQEGAPTCLVRTYGNVIHDVSLKAP